MIKKSKIILIYCSHFLISKTVELSSSFVSISLCLRRDLGKSMSIPLMNIFRRRWQCYRESHTRAEILQHEVILLGKFMQ